MSGTKSIEVKGLSFTYKGEGAVRAVDSLDLDVERGEFIVIMGPSGAGKSTLANSLNGLIPGFIRGKYEGSVLVNGKEARSTPVNRMASEIGLVFQDFEAQLFSTNVNLEIAFGPENFAVDRAEIAARIEKILRTIKLEGFEGRQPATLSGGQKQRLAIGSVLATYPGIICMDEPTTDLDPVGKLGIFNIAKELHEDSEFTLIIIEHETEEALNADRLVIMKEGRIVAQGKPADVLRDVAFTDEVGIMSLQIPKLLSELGACGRDDLPMLPAEGAEFFARKGLFLDRERFREMLDRDEARERGYGDTIVAVDRLSHVYPNGNKAVDDISLVIREREFIAILGHNGSGKTTLVKHLNGLLSPSSGSVTICGKNTAEHSIFEIGKEIGYVFQNPDHQIFADTVFDEVAFSPKIRGCPAEEVSVRVQEALEAVDMAGYEEKDPFSLSKGERQRVAVASVLSARPRIIILDEPTTGLDYKEQKRMMELIKKLNDSGHTIIMITHTMWVVSEYAHRVAAIKDGKVMMDGRTRDVFAREKELYDSFLKTPHIVSLGNMLGGTVLSVEEMKYCTGGLE
ncbi:MAG: cobalt ABC transporter ATP-binding protein [Spirochaetae bacterium HGW-Spirochaetae-3]|jgi:energy-coupling factor transport system ATP-binding protein|nr:MAG: cobalt ABC transporter ATP-binding protein [Spirochaetae bacterium HGW-Spirochaetae-3]